MLNQLINISRRYGSDPAFVLAGGGNTSFKSADRLWVKASGHSLATIDESGFVELDRNKLDAMMAATWPADPTAREAAFVEAVMAARLHPELNQRPSVEALLHHLLPQPLVVHTHPGVVNALTCCTKGESLAQQWLGHSAVWQPYVDPGLTLALRLKETLHRAGGKADLILLQNHGLIVAGESADAIDAATNKLTAAIHAQLGPAQATAAGNSAAIERFGAHVARVTGEEVATSADTSAMWIASTPQGLAAAKLGPLTPDQIVYCRSFPPARRPTILWRCATRICRRTASTRGWPSSRTSASSRFARVPRWRKRRWKSSSTPPPSTATPADSAACTR
jgi:rhamnose utilization protein RhaD (predicted bifunctional aldolase and dehydrogenase)